MLASTQSLQYIFEQFKTESLFASAKPYGGGHINDTYLVTTQKAPHYLLQRINHHVFKSPVALIENIAAVTTFLQTKLSKIGINSARHCLTLMPSEDKTFSYQDSDGYYWVCYLFIEGSCSYDFAKNAKQAYAAGKTIGHFLNHVADFPVHELQETLPLFHRIDFRLAQFSTALQQDSMRRAKDCAAEISFVQENAQAMSLILQLGSTHQIPLRVTHNDTKLNNILFDANDDGLCVIDLDTVMPGYVHYDFSDAARTIINTVPEDEVDLNKIQINIDHFKAFSEGFIRELKDSLQPNEINALAAATPLMPFIHGLRFLTDHLSGDIYYKIHFANQNLQRARSQFQLVRCMQAKMNEFERIIQDIVAEIGDTTVQPTLTA